MEQSTPTTVRNIVQVGPVTYVIQKGFVQNMRTEGMFFVDKELKEMVFEELKQGGAGSFFYRP